MEPNRSLAVAFAAAVLTVSSLGHAQAPPPSAYPPPAQGRPSAYPGAQQPIGYRTESEPRYGMVAAGAVLLGVGYLAPLSIVAVAEFPNDSEWMAVPVAGPFITMARMDWYQWCSQGIECVGKGFGNVFGGIGLVLTGVMQAGGATLLIVGLAAQKERQVPVYAVAPMPLGDDGYGLGVSGRF